MSAKLPKLNTRTSRPGETGTQRMKTASIDLQTKRDLPLSFVRRLTVQPLTNRQPVSYTPHN